MDDAIRVLSDKNEVMKEYICEQIGFGGMFTLNEQGEKVVSCEYFASSEEERDAFYRNVNPYLQKASLLISTIGGDIRY